MRILPFLALCFTTVLSAQRQVIPLAEHWRFIREDVGVVAAPNDQWRSVSIPHTWNIVEMPVSAPGGKYRGAGWYVRNLDLPPGSAEKRVFVRFEAASIVSDVFVNGRHVGQHRGAFGAFCYEITSFLRFDGTDTLRVRVDNSFFQDVAPLEGDFTMHGGLYRPVSVILTDPTCISPMDHASSGVYLTVKSLSKGEAVLDVRAMIENGLLQNAHIQVEADIVDAAGHTVVTGKSDAVLTSREQKAIGQELKIQNPHRWRGRLDPYLYTAKIRLKRENRIVDEIAVSLGLRTIEIDQDRGVLLNGEPYAVHGVNRHQDRSGKGWALSPTDHAEDIQMILEMGCTGLRLAHYQQSSQVHDLCDRSGLLVWQEIPLVNRISGLPQFAENAKQQLTEMVLQGYNHPSLCFWGLFNELNATWANPPGPAPDALIAELRQLANRLDSTRPTVAASYMREPSTLHALPDWIAFNVYPGWYWGKPDDFAKLVPDLVAPLNGKRIGISEYGAGASILHHEEGTLVPPKNTGSHFHPEEWQAALHEWIWSLAKDNPHLWGTFLWVMFDFSSEGRDEGDAPGRNDKGLVTADRKVRKDAFYFYQSNWSDVPMVHIASRRMTPRKIAETEVKIYSNCSEVELRVNGKSLGKAKPDGVHTFRWPGVKLATGENRIEAISKRGKKEIMDQCVWVLEAPGK